MMAGAGTLGGRWRAAKSPKKFVFPSLEEGRGKALDVLH